MAKRVDPRRVNIHWTHTPDEWARKLGVHKNTILRWIKDEGLEAITDRRPYLIRGVELKDFLLRKQKKRRFERRPGDMVCFKCSQSRKPADIGLEYEASSLTSGRLFGLCNVCLTTIHLIVKRSEISELFPGYEVTEQQCQSTLSGSRNARVNVHKQGQWEAVKNTASKQSNQP